MSRHEITIPIQEDPSSLYEHGKFERTEIIFLVAGATRSGGPGGWGLCGWDERGVGRTVFQGPLVHGPHAELYGLCGVIDTRGGTSREHAEARAEGRLYRVEAGDVLVINGVEWVLSINPHYYPVLTRI